MKTSVRLLLASSAMLFALTVLLVSLASSVPRAHSAGESSALNDKQFYMTEEILPDHVLYPVLMTVDRVKLESATPLERLYIQIEFAQRRFEFAQALLEKDNKPLALTTITKSQKYMLHAAGEAMAQPELPATTKEYLLKSLAYHHQAVKEIIPSFSDSQRVVLDQLNSETFVLIEQLRNK